jgi:hypothetical protein
MNPPWHVFFGGLFSIFLFFLFPEIEMINLFLIFFSSILIDVDHYLFYIYEKRGFSLRKAYAYFINHKKKWKNSERDSRKTFPTSFFIFHGLEVLLLLFALSFFFKPLYFIFIGFSFHLCLDLIEQAAYSNKSQKISILNDFLNYKG